MTNPLLWLLKLIDFGSWSIVRFLGLVLLLAFCFTSGASAQKRLSQRCPGSTSSAKVEISKKGDITIAKCPGRSTTIDGASLPVAPVKRYAALLVANAGAVSVAQIIENTLGYDVNWATSATGVYNGVATGSVFTSAKTVMRISLPRYLSTVKPFCTGRFFANTTAKLECFNYDGTATDLVNDVTMPFLVEIEVYQ